MAVGFIANPGFGSEGSCWCFLTCKELSSCIVDGTFTARATVAGQSVFYGTPGSPCFHCADGPNDRLDCEFRSVPGCGGSKLALTVALASHDCAHVTGDDFGGNVCDF